MPAPHVTAFFLFLTLGIIRQDEPEKQDHKTVFVAENGVLKTGSKWLHDFSSSRQAGRKNRSCFDEGIERGVRTPLMFFILFSGKGNSVRHGERKNARQCFTVLTPQHLNSAVRYGQGKPHAIDGWISSRF